VAQEGRVRLPLKVASRAFPLDQLQQSAVFDAGPLHADDSVNFMQGRHRASLAGTPSSNRTFKAAPEVDVEIPAKLNAYSGGNPNGIPG
jgi:hypothetical protein